VRLALELGGIVKRETNSFNNRVRAPRRVRAAVPVRALANDDAVERTVAHL
jgi:hypothetical protein